MRLLVPLLVLALAVPHLHAADEKRRKNEDIIPEVKLDRTTPVVFEKEIEPILVNKCAFCHSGSIKEGKLDLASYDSMMRGGKRGPSVIPGKGGESLLFKLSKKDIKPYMPPRSEEALTPNELALIKLWIDQGAKPPTGSRVPIKVVVKAPPKIVNPVLGVGISPDKALIISARGNQVHGYDATGKHLQTLLDPAVVGPDKKPVAAAHLSLVESLAFSPDGKWLATGSFKEVKLWDAKTGKLTKTIPDFAERVVALAFSPDSKLLATGGGPPTQDGEIKLIDVASGKITIDIKNNLHSDTVFGIAFSPDGKMLASAGADKFVKVWEVPSGKFLKSFEGHTHHVMGVGFSSDNKLLASAGADNVVKIWDYEKGEQVRTINAATKQLTSLTFVPKKNEFLTVSGDSQVRRWNTNGGNTRNFTASDFLYCVAVSEDGTLVAAGGQDGTVKLYNGNSGALIKSILPPGVEETPKK